MAVSESTIVWGEADPVHQDDGAWWFWDETWASVVGPYGTEQMARDELRLYCLRLNGADDGDAGEL